MQFRNIYETPSTIRVNCQLFLLANSFDVDYPVDDAMQKRHLVFSLNTVNESGPPTDKFLNFVSDFGEYLPLFNAQKKEENYLREQQLEQLRQERRTKGGEEEQNNKTIMSGSRSKRKNRTWSGDDLRRLIQSERSGCKL